MRFKVFICERGDVFVFDAESGKPLFSPYGVNVEDLTMSFRMLVVQDAFAITCDDLADASEFLEKNHSYSWRYETWIAQIISANIQIDERR